MIAQSRAAGVEAHYNNNNKNNMRISCIARTYILNIVLYYKYRYSNGTRFVTREEFVRVVKLLFLPNSRIIFNSVGQRIYVCSTRIFKQ